MKYNKNFYFPFQIFFITNFQEDFIYYFTKRLKIRNKKVKKRIKRY
jgi:hypothetical protein